MFMTGRGRPAAPLETALARGSEGARDRAASAPPRVEGVPNPPAWFTPDALTCWIRMCDLLFARGQLTRESETSLIALCVCYSDWVELVQDIQINGRTTVTYTQGGGAKDVVRPEVTVFSDTDRRLRGWLTEFGLTDATRGKVGGTPSAPTGGDDPLAAYGLQ